MKCECSQTGDGNLCGRMPSYRVTFTTGEPPSFLCSDCLPIVKENEWWSDLIAAGEVVIRKLTRFQLDCTCPSLTLSRFGCPRVRGEQKCWDS